MLLQRICSKIGPNVSNIRKFSSKIDQEIASIKEDKYPALKQFNSHVYSAKNDQEKLVGGDWKAWMLRNKSTDDLHKLWFVLLIERNALLAEKQECKRRQIIMPNPSRKVKVQKSMARIKFILHERSVEYKKNLKN